jgi:large subunit ribosomal protein L32
VEFAMPVPKRKTSKSRRDKRSASKFIRTQAITACQNCQEPISTHQACLACGYYKGRKVIATRLERTIKRTEHRASKQAAARAQEEESSQAGHEQQE